MNIELKTYTKIYKYQFGVVTKHQRFSYPYPQEKELNIFTSRPSQNILEKISLKNHGKSQKLSNISLFFALLNWEKIKKTVLTPERSFSPGVNHQKTEAEKERGS